MRPLRILFSGNVTYVIVIVILIMITITITIIIGLLLFTFSSFYSIIFVSSRLGMPWSFIPQQDTVMVMPGEPTLVFYKAVSNQLTILILSYG